MLPKSVLSGSMISGTTACGMMHRRVSPPAPEFSVPLVCAAVIFGLVVGIAVAGVVLPTVTHTVVPAIVRTVTGA